MDGQTVWLTQLQMAEMFQSTPRNITVQNIYEEREQTRRQLVRNTFKFDRRVSGSTGAMGRDRNPLSP
jgi:hypothetical protein